MLPNIPQGGLQEGPFPQLPTVPAVHRFPSLPVTLPHVPKLKRGPQATQRSTTMRYQKKGRPNPWPAAWPAGITSLGLPPLPQPLCKAERPPVGRGCTNTAQGEGNPPGGPAPLTRGTGGRRREAAVPRAHAARGTLAEFGCPWRGGTGFWSLAGPRCKAAGLREGLCWGFSGTPPPAGAAAEHPQTHRREARGPLLPPAGGSPAQRPLAAGTAAPGRAAGRQLRAPSRDRGAGGAHGEGLSHPTGLSGSAACGREGGKAATVACSRQWGADGWWERIWPLRAGKRPKLPPHLGQGAREGQARDPRPTMRMRRQWAGAGRWGQPPASGAVDGKQDQAPQIVGSDSEGLLCVLC